MATYTLTTTAGQEAKLSDVAAHEGYKSNQAFLEAVVFDAVAVRHKRRDEDLIHKAENGVSLTAAQQARIKTVLGLS